MLLRLPDDLLLCIADSLRTRTVSRLCRRTWGLLRHRHLTIHDGHLLDAMTAAGPRLCTVVCNLKCVPLSITHAHLCFGPVVDHLRHMALTLNHGDAGAVLMVAGACPVLETLRLTCHGQPIPRGAFALCEPLRNPCLRSLSLNVSRTFMDGPTLAALADVLLAGPAPALTEVCLDLRYNHYIAAQDVAHLAALLDPRRGLEHVDIALTCNTWNGDQALASLAERCGEVGDGRLRTLRLALNETGITAWGVGPQGLHRILTAHRHTLSSLLFHASNCDLGSSHGVRPLMAALSVASSLRCLDLDLSSNGLRDGGAFARIGHLGHLESLRLDLSGNVRLGSRTAHGLGVALRPDTLRCLELVLTQTFVRADDGASPVPLSLRSCAWWGDGPGLVALLRRCHPAELRCLTVRVEDQGLDCWCLADSLRSCVGVGQLVLQLSGCSIGDYGLACLAHAAGQLPLRKLALHLDTNDLSLEGLFVLRPLLCNLRRSLRHLHLDLSHNCFGDGCGAVDAVAEALLMVPAETRIHLLLRGVAQSPEERATLHARVRERLGRPAVFVSV